MNSGLLMVLNDFLGEIIGAVYHSGFIKPGVA